MPACIFSSGKQRFCAPAVAALALVAANAGRALWAAPSANPVAGEFEGEHHSSER